MRFFLLLVCVLAVSCKDKTDDSGHIAPKTMQKILLDVNIAEAYSTIVKDSAHHSAGKNADSLAAYYKDIFSHYHITDKEFEESLNWYKAHPEKLDTVYNSIVPLITAMQNPRPLKKI